MKISKIFHYFLFLALQLTEQITRKKIERMHVKTPSVFINVFFPTNYQKAMSVLYLKCTGSEEISIKISVIMFCNIHFVMSWLCKRGVNEKKISSWWQSCCDQIGIVFEGENNWMDLHDPLFFLIDDSVSISMPISKTTLIFSLAVKLETNFFIWMQLHSKWLPIYGCDVVWHVTSDKQFHKPIVVRVLGMWSALII